MLHYVYQLVANFICLLFIKGLSGVFAKNTWVLWLETKVMGAMEVNQNS